MGMKVHQRAVGSKVVIDGINTKMRIGDGRTRHVDKVNDLLKIGGRTVGIDVVNDEDWMGGRKANTLHI